MKLNFLWTLCLMLAMTGFSCSKGKEKCSDVNEPSSFAYATVRIDFRSAAGDYLVRQSGGTYKLSDIKVYDSKLNEVAYTPIPIAVPNAPEAYWINVPLLNGLEGKFNTGEVYRPTYYLDIKGSRQTIEYELLGKQLECGSMPEYIKVKYNGQQVASVTNTMQAQFTITQ